MPFRGHPEGGIETLEGSVRIRPAEPDDSTFLATVILMASRSHLPRGIWDLVIPASEEDRLDFVELATLLEARSFCHYANFLVAEGTDGPTAALAAYDPGEPGLLAAGHLIAVVGEEMGMSQLEIADAYRRLEPYHTAVPEQRKGLWTIEWVGTTPGLRRRGLVSALIERVLEEGRLAGFRQAQITTFLGNEPAARAYHKAGFRTAEERRHPYFESVLGAPGLVRFERDL